MRAGIYLVDRAKARLDAQLDAAIATANAEAGAVQLDTVGSRIYRHGQPAIGTYPAVIVSAPDLDLARLDLDARVAQATAPIQIVAWVQHPDYETMIDQAHRMVEVLTELMVRHESCGAGTWPVTAAQRVRAGALPGSSENDQLVTGAALLMTVAYDTTVRLGED